MLENIKTTAAIAGGLTTILGFLTVCIKPIRNIVIQYFNKLFKDGEQDISINELKELMQKVDSSLDLHTEAHLCTLRNRITNIYYKYHSSETIPDFEKKNLIEHYTIYKKLGGNSYVDEIYAELKTKKII